MNKHVDERSIEKIRETMLVELERNEQIRATAIQARNNETIASAGGDAAAAKQADRQSEFIALFDRKIEALKGALQQTDDDLRAKIEADEAKVRNDDTARARALAAKLVAQTEAADDLILTFCAAVREIRATSTRSQPH